MHLVIFALGLYIVFAEWRNQVLRRRLDNAEKNLNKFKKDKTIWYSGVLPNADKLCLIEEKSGGYVVSRLSDKRWMKKDGEVDFDKIKRWTYIEDLESL